MYVKYCTPVIEFEHLQFYEHYVTKFTKRQPKCRWLYAGN